MIQEYQELKATNEAIIIRTGFHLFMILDSGFVRNTPLNPPNPPLSKGGEGGFSSIRGCHVSSGAWEISPE